MAEWLQIVLAVLAPSGVLVTLLEKMRRENNRDHSQNSELLKTVDRKVDGVAERMNDHIEWHLDHKEK